MATLLSAPIPSRPECIVIVHHSQLAPSPSEWSAYCRMCRDSIAHAKQRKVPITTLVFTDKAGPSAPQRKEAAEAVAPMANAQRSAVVCTSAIVRGICTAMSWIGISVRAFNPEQSNDALTSLGITAPAEVAEAREVVRQLCAGLDAPSVAARPFTRT